MTAKTRWDVSSYVVLGLAVLIGLLASPTAIAVTYCDGWMGYLNMLCW